MGLGGEMAKTLPCCRSQSVYIRFDRYLSTNPAKVETNLSLKVERKLLKFEFAISNSEISCSFKVLGKNDKDTRLVFYI